MFENDFGTMNIILYEKSWVKWKLLEKREENNPHDCYAIVAVKQNLTLIWEEAFGHFYFQKPLDWPTYMVQQFQ